MSATKSRYNFGVALAAAAGSLTYGYVISILANTLGNADFYEYMKLNLTGDGASTTESWVAAWNCLLYAGSFLGCLCYPWMSSKFGRRIPLAVGATLVIIGGGMQAGEVHAVMLCIARIVTGLGMGNLVVATPLYQAEISPAETRGLFVGLHGALIGAGISLAQWMGVAFYHTHGAVSWRVPMALQCVPPLLLLSILFFLPESPRWLYLNGRSEAAQKVLQRLHKDSADPEGLASQKEFILMKTQLDFEAEELSQGLSKIWKDPHLRKRFVCGFLAITGTQVSGAIVILTYSSVIYTTLGFTPFVIGIVVGCWAIGILFSCFLGGVIADRVGRVRQITTGLICSAICLVIVGVLTAHYAGTTNRGGNDAAVFFIFLFVICYGAGVESPSFIYASELFPSAWRPLGVGVSGSANPFWSLIFTGVASPAFATIGWKFFMVFVSGSVFMAAVTFFYYPETKGLTLEEISKLFGDEVVQLDEKGHVMHTNNTSDGEDKGQTLRIEDTQGDIQTS